MILILQHLCKLRCNLLCASNSISDVEISQKWELAAVASLMGLAWTRRQTRCSSKLPYYWKVLRGGGKLTKPFSLMFRLSDSWKKQSINQNWIDIRIPLCWYREEIGVPLQTSILHARSPGNSNCSCHVMLGPQVNPGGLFIWREFRRRNSSGEPTSRCDT